LAIKVDTFAVDSYGSEIPTETAVATVYGKVTLKSGSEFDIGDARRGVVTGKARIRWDSSIGTTGAKPTQEMYFYHDSRKFSIDSIIRDDERKRTMTLTITEVTA